MTLQEKTTEVRFKLRILFVNGQSYLPQVIGGVETSTRDLCHTLQENGHHTAIMAELDSGDMLWAVNRVKSKILGCLFPADSYNGVRIYRGWDHIGGLGEVFAKEKPDVAVIQCSTPVNRAIAEACLQQGINTAIYIHDAGSLRNMWTTAPPPEIKLIANSAFTAGLLQRQFGRNCDVVPPVMIQNKSTSVSSRKTVTMINPRALKGGQIALDICRACPDIPFTFVEAWNGNNPEVQHLKRLAAQLPNATWLPAQTDMQPIYASTKILLTPSQCEETWGRVITEAHFFGIPALASKIGALPDTVGPGGLLINPDADVASWVSALRSLWDNVETYNAYSASALSFSAREEIAPRHVAEGFLRALQA